MGGKVEEEEMRVRAWGDCSMLLRPSSLPSFLLLVPSSCALPLVLFRAHTAATPPTHHSTEALGGEYVAGMDEAIEQLCCCIHCLLLLLCQELSCKREGGVGAGGADSEEAEMR